VYVDGRLQTRSWDKEGETRYSTEIVAEGMKMLPSGSSKSKDDPASEEPPARGKKSAAKHDDGPF